MNPTFVVLANLTDTAEQAARYAAVLGEPLHARVALLHLYHDPLLDPELATVTTAQAYRTQAEVAAGLADMAGRLPAPAEVTVSVQAMPAAVEEAVQRHQPLLLAMGLSTEHDLLDHLLHNQALPVLRATHRPLLLVPEAAPPARVPRRVVLAIDAERFTLNAAARALAPLLRAWPAAYTVVHVAAAHERQAFPGQRALGQVHLSGLLPVATPLELYEESHLSPATGVLQALDDVQADLVVLIARPRSFLGRLFHQSVTAQVLRHSRVPVLLLPAEAPTLPGWMPGLS
ncbi:Universal stress protein family protein [Hymenobacter daecheongensis DSM 21074]|uniref:Universal stress protein family protein n=1 Tax=Hymenobacter daecheongensis DSM 21074 TaxID=1121955 RepID=A0A1M6MDW7_9BACT|nr:universal stress protein [Hymenobacter daecheongensis]SHJ81637.1 Universal stress protein family protein [Hymenobacter daecheongensis DSM 21074]